MRIEYVDYVYFYVIICVFLFGVLLLIYFNFLFIFKCYNSLIINFDVLGLNDIYFCKFGVIMLYMYKFRYVKF